MGQHRSQRKVLETSSPRATTGCKSTDWPGGAAASDQPCVEQALDKAHERLAVGAQINGKRRLPL